MHRGGFSSSNVNYSVSGLTYDNNGNIKTMNQYGLKTGSTSAIIDQLTYNYTNTTNKLLNVIDAANDAASTLSDFHYPAATKTTATVDYTYDANGNLISDANKKISSIVYNYLNLPQVITITGKGTITYFYDAAGNKLKKVTVDNSVTPALTTTTLYLGSSVYQNDTLQFFGTSEGRLRPNAANTAFIYDYFLKDHLGNTRMVITDDYNVASPILEATSFYPFGLQQKGIGLTQETNPLHNKYTYNGKELQEDLGLDQYDYGARFYDAQIGRWNSMDSLAAKKPWGSSYSYCFNNPINVIDPDGKDEFLLTWLPKGDAVGHSAIAIQERDSKGNLTGNLIVRHLWPEGGTAAPGKNYNADYRTEVISEKDLSKFGGGEGRGADGIVQITGDAHQDNVMSKSLDYDEKTVNLDKNGVSQYNIEKNSCATYTMGAVESVGVDGSSDATVSIVGKTSGITYKTAQVTTPGSVYQAVVNSGDKRVSVVKALPSGNGNPNITIEVPDKKIIKNLKGSN